MAGRWTLGRPRRSASPLARSASSVRTPGRSGPRCFRLRPVTMDVVEATSTPPRRHAGSQACRRRAAFPWVSPWWRARIGYEPQGRPPEHSACRPCTDLATHEDGSVQDIVSKSCEPNCSADVRRCRRTPAAARDRSRRVLSCPRSRWRDRRHTSGRHRAGHARPAVRAVEARGVRDPAAAAGRRPRLGVLRGPRLAGAGAPGVPGAVEPRGPGAVAARTSCSSPPSQRTGPDASRAGGRSSTGRWRVGQRS